MDVQNFFWIGLLGAAMALLFALSQSRKVLKFSEGTDLMKKIAASIRSGADAYLKRQYTAVFKFFVIMTVVLAILAVVKFVSPFVPFAFIT
ncbi:MAG: sodium/proton-translocating pyrophosphatase, partial [Hydrogenoanaerobacterium sp.]